MQLSNYSEPATRPQQDKAPLLSVQLDSQHEGALMTHIKSHNTLNMLSHLTSKLETIDANESTQRGANSAIAKRPEPNMIKTDYAVLLAKSTREHKEKKARSKRKILTEEESELLESHFRRDPNWDNEKLNMLSQRLNRSRTQVYKWNWDRKQKEVRSAGHIDTQRQGTDNDSERISSSDDKN